MYLDVTYVLSGKQKKIQKKKMHIWDAASDSNHLESLRQA
jgi:hypothetical protein